MSIEKSNDLRFIFEILDYFYRLFTQNTQILTGLSTFNDLLDEEQETLKFKKGGVGRGHTKDGSKKSWKKKYYFEQDLLKLNVKQLGEVEFKRKYAGTSAEEIKAFWNMIKENVIRPKETEMHARNKLLMWLDKLHNSLTWKSIKNQYQIGTATAIGYVEDILNGIIKTFNNKNIITFPNEHQRLEMVQMNMRRGVQLPGGLFTLDGKHALCTGRNRRERRSYKYRYLPCFNVMFVIERVFGTVCAFNLDASASKHDSRILRESEFFRNIDHILNGWIVMADKAYIGIDSKNIAAAMRKTDKRKDWYSKEFWKIFNGARGDSERVFAHFFYNKFTQLSKWPGKASDAFVNWAKNVTCCIVLYNYLKLHTASAI